MAKIFLKFFVISALIITAVWFLHILLPASLRWLSPEEARGLSFVILPDFILCIGYAAYLASLSHEDR